MEVKLLIHNKINEAYVRMIFNAHKNGPVKIDRNHDLGRYLISRIRYSNTPAKQTIGTTLLIPRTPNNPAENHFCYFNIDDQDKINDYIQADYRLWFKTTLTIATDDLKLSKTDSIYYIMDLLKFKRETTIFENMKKFDYRRRSKIKKFLLTSIHNIGL